LVGLDTRYVDTVLDNGIDAVAALDADLRIHSWNEAIADLSGVSSAEAVGASLFALFPQARSGPIETALRSALDGELVVGGGAGVGGPTPTIIAATTTHLDPQFPD
jgi:PAS domain S-box-containing protein